LAAAIETNQVKRKVFPQLRKSFEHTRPVSSKLLFRVTGSMADAEDVSQLCSSGWLAGVSIRAVSQNMQSYLQRSAVNAALDLIRARGHREVMPVEAADELQSNASLSPERALSSMENQELASAGSWPH